MSAAVKAPHRSVDGAGTGVTSCPPISIDATLRKPLKLLPVMVMLLPAAAVSGEMTIVGSETLCLLGIGYRLRIDL